MRVPERTPGPSFLLRACEFGLSRGYRHFFYGGAEGVPQRLAERLRQRYPGIQIVGAYSPPFRELTEAEEAEVKEMIEAARPHLLWVGLGGPKQNLWMASHVGKIGVPVMLGVGAAFDFHSGNRLWAPAWIRKCGLEWLFRTFTGGRATFRRNIWCLSVVSCLLAKACIQKYVSPRFALKVR
ncbi:MAG: putative N-acetylmannosaminyltransferase [candidate division BRC1 bacterium ADurb.BinA364]|nr:MAG: putative N-acetylmannosaminyltransferase [candidate division BRC1 bacterium ADurb.BinA364]